MVYVLVEGYVLQEHNVGIVLGQVGGTKKVIPKQACVYRVVIQMRTLAIVKGYVYGITAIFQLGNNAIGRKIVTVIVIIV
jgi:hypothetical protein